MGKVSLIFVLILSLAGTAWGAQTLYPTDTGTPNSMGASYGFFDVGDYDCGACHAVVEFDLSASIIPNSQVCGSYLNGLVVTDVDDAIGDGIMNINLYNLSDATEDGVVNNADFGNSSGPVITTFAINPTSVGTRFDNIDVTQAVQQDLFDAGNYSGFILISPDAIDEGVSFDPAEPTLRLVPCESVPTMTPWGIIIFIVLAGIGAVYFLRRRKITG